MELVDVYTKDRIRTGKVIGRNDKVQPGEYLLLVHICIFDGNHRMLIQQRSPDKDRYPNGWDVSAGGFVRSGETSARAMRRELLEELGLDRPEESLQLMLTEPFSYVFDDFYLLHSQPELSSLKLQTEEVQAVKWASEEEILHMSETGEFVDYEVQLLNRIFAFERGDRA